jgi:quinohemoprotein ethanol dehydrogenase
MIGRLLGLFATTALVAAAIIAARSGSTSIASAEGALAPAFTAQQLSQPPVDNWITNGGALSNERYSPLKLIDESNVGQLKGVWMTQLPGATAAKYSAEGQPLEYNGVIYIPIGTDDVFAISVDTGKALWQYQAHLDSTISTVCCGWVSRGLALGDGKLFIGQLDGKLVAVDQATGNVAWSTQAADWKAGTVFTAAPLYVDGLVIAGVAGGEFKARGHLMAFNATTGKEVWRFYTVPSPGQRGFETWPQTGDAWKGGGASIWQTPSADPKLGMLYFSTGNASPDDDGAIRPGANLFSVSIVALDIKTGKLRWYYQMVHHDLWDYDAPSPTLLFDATIHGKLVYGIGEAPKTGFLYLLDRTNGKPIYPTPEKPVPQEADQATYPTQPFPSVPPPLAIQVPTADQVAEIQKRANGAPMAIAKYPYTPYKNTMMVTAPGPAGGTNWAPSSYDPVTHRIYVCGQNGVAGMTAGDAAEPSPNPNGAPVHDVGSIWTVGGPNTGYFDAVDVTTGKMVWTQHFADACYSGSVVTAGNLVFVGRNGGELQAYSAKTGALLWHFQTGAGANNVATVFRHNGKEYLAFFAGGNALGATPHGDNLWLFGLDGTLGPAPPPGAGTGVQHAGEGTPVPLAPANATSGATVFTANCALCHGASGTGGNGGPDLTSLAAAKDMTKIVQQVTNGGSGMPAFQATLTPQQIVDVSAYVVQTMNHGK